MYQPEYGLGYAIIKKAVIDYISLNTNRQEQYYQREAEGWLFGLECEDNPHEFTFLWWCRELTIDPKRVRKFARHYRSNKINFGTISERKFVYTRRLAEIYSSSNLDIETHFIRAA